MYHTKATWSNLNNLFKHGITILHQSIGNQLSNTIRKEKSLDGRGVLYNNSLSFFICKDRFFFLQCVCLAAHKRCKHLFMQEWRETKTHLRNRRSMLLITIIAIESSFRLIFNCNHYTSGSACSTDQIKSRLNLTRTDNYFS